MLMLITCSNQLIIMFISAHHHVHISSLSCSYQLIIMFISAHHHVHISSLSCSYLHQITWRNVLCFSYHILWTFHFILVPMNFAIYDIVHGVKTYFAMLCCLHNFEMRLKYQWCLENCKLHMQFSWDQLYFRQNFHIVGRESKTRIFDFYIFQERKKNE